MLRSGDKKLAQTWNISIGLSVVGGEAWYRCEAIKRLDIVSGEE